MLVAAGVLLAGLFRDHVLGQFTSSLTAQLDRLAAVIEFDAEGRPRIDPAALGDPRWQRPYSGLYWQVDALPAAGPRAPARAVAAAESTDPAASAIPATSATSATPAAADAADAADPADPADPADAAPRTAVLRSRSLWDAELTAPPDAIADGAVHVHAVPGPGGAALWLVERSVRTDPADGRAWRLLVAADLRETQAAIRRFNGVLALGLAALLLLMAVGAWAQVAVGLAPLKTLRGALTALRDGRAPRLAGRFPAEVQPLVDDFNGVLDRHDALVTRARTQAGNLAHALKTPLAAMSQSAAMAARAVGPAAPAMTPAPATATARESPEASEVSEAPEASAAQVALSTLPSVVREQVARAQRQVDWHLARSRAAAAHGLPGVRAEVGPALAGLARVMGRIHAERGLALELEPVDPALAFAGEAQDLQEMAGNIIDNACKWAAHRVRVAARATRDGPRARLRIVVEDDGPGIGAQARSRALQRGVRLDESVPGSGLGLAIVQELAGLYEGSLHLDASPGGGLRVELDLPAVPDGRVHHPPGLALRSSSKAGGLGAGQRGG